MGGHEPQPLPEVVFKVIEDASELLPIGVTDKQAISFGFNGANDWTSKEKKDGTEVEARYQRWLQPMESDLARQVEYDMDEQDQVWLDNVNKERAADRQPPVSYETFEIIFDKLEKEYFDLTKRIPKKQSTLPNEDSKCAICDDGECENSNAIVFCDGCNLAVHQDCYGVPYIPEGQWLCRKCTVSPDKPVTCVLCPNSYGAFKQTTTAQWAHLLCAIWVPDTGVSNTVYMEPIDGVENISKNRWKLVCYLCRKRVGACIQCANRNCFTAFHVTCARERGLELKMKQGTERGELRAYCERHSEGFVAPEANGDGGDKQSLVLNLKRSKTGQAISLKHSTGASHKSARAYKKTYSSGPPLVPAYVYDRVMEYCGRIRIGKKPAFIGQVCRYWSLKREARRGAPLLKRLHLEPWTASATSHQQTDVEKAKKLELIRHLRNDLEKVRMLTELVRKREKKKLERVNLLKRVMDDYIFPKDKVMRDVLQRIALLDKQHFFARPVSKLHTPDYYDIIKAPMDWATMHEKLDRHEYLTTQDFQDDIELVINNARLYNKKESSVHRSAVRVSEGAEPILAELESLDSPDPDASHEGLPIATDLTPEIIEHLFDYHYDPPSPPKPPKVVALATNGKGKGKASDSPTPKSRKRNFDLTGLDDGVIRESPRTRAKRGEDAEVLEQLQLVSTRVNAREAARLRAEAATVENSTPEKSSKKNKRKTMDTEAEEKEASVKKVAAHAEPPALVLVDDVDNRSSFKNFNTGWVLPEGSRRRTTTANSTHEPVASGSGTKHDTPAPAPPPPAPQSTVDPPQSSRPAPKSHKGKQKAKEVEPTPKERSATPIVVEEPPNPVAQVAASPAKNASPTKKQMPEDSKLAIKLWQEKFAELAPKYAITKLSQIPDGTLVWAKQPGYPSWPAEVQDPNDPESPQIAKPSNGDTHALVSFFDDSGTGNWIPLKNLHLMHEDEEFDQLFMNVGALSNLKNKSKSSKSKDLLKRLEEGYNRAVKMAEIPEDLESTSPGKKGGKQTKKKK